MEESDTAAEDNSDCDEGEDIMTKTVRLLEEEGRKIRVEKWVKPFNSFRVEKYGPR